MITIKNESQIEKMRKAGALLHEVLGLVREEIEPGVTTQHLDQLAEKLIRERGAIPSSKGYNGFPYSICASVYDQVVHVFPNKAVAGNHLGDIGYAVQAYAESLGYGVIRDLCGHGIGTEMHEDPNVPNYGRPHRGVRLQKGMTITIEPMIAMGTWKVYQEDDGWTIVTRDGKPCSHYEHTLLITDGEPELLSWPGMRVSEVLK